MKLLFISQRINNRTSGAKVVSTTNLEVARRVFGSSGVDVYSIIKSKKSKFKNISNKLHGRLDGLSIKDIDAIEMLIVEQKYDYIYIDSSYFGLLAQNIRAKFPDIKIITFYHDVLVHWWKETHQCSFLSYIFNFFVYFNSERKCTKVSDINIVMTQRDTQLLVKTYKLDINSIYKIPLSVNTDMKYVYLGSSTSIPLSLLFIGVDYKPNTDGLEWFLRYVQPFIPITLTIIGKGLEKYKTKWECENVSVLGAVDKIEPFYTNASAVIIPLFSGSGMKVKTAEAMSYGKPIFATDEGLTGYEIGNTPGIFRCNSAEDFIQSITNWISDPSKHTYISEIQNLFNTSYSLDAAVKIFQKVIQV